MRNRFELTCTSLCELAGLGVPDVQSDGQGGLSVALHLNDVPVDLLGESGDAERFYTRVVLGPVDSLDDPMPWGLLLEANFVLANAGGPVYSRDPDNGQALLQQAWPSDTHASQLLRVLMAQCDFVRGRRHGQGGGAPPLESLQPTVQPDTAGQPGAATACQALFASLGRAAGLADLAVQTTPSGITTVLLTVADVDVQLCHLRHQPSRLHILSDIGSANAFDESAAGGLAEINAWLLNHPHGAVICRRPVCHDYVLWQTVPLDDNLTGEQLLQAARSRANAALTVRKGLLADPSQAPSGLVHFA